jgi:uncharacterized protein (TIGR02147 family)
MGIRPLQPGDYTLSTFPDYDECLSSFLVFSNMAETEDEAVAPGSVRQADAVSEPCIYQYLDYRLFIKDRFHWLQSRDPSFSQRKLARVAGFANPGFFNEVIKGRRKLSSAAIERMGEGLSLDANGVEFLRVLVALTDAKDTEEKRAAMRKLEFRRNRSFFRRLNQSQSKYYLDLNYPLVRAAIGVCDFRGDYQVLGDFLRPPMTAASIKRYVRDLCEWELVAQDREGRYCVTHSFLEPPEQMKDALVRLQQAWLTQSVHLLSTMPASERHVSSALLTVSEGTYKAILERVEKMREELLDLVRADQSSEKVVQFNIQVFPRSGGKRNRTVPPDLAKGGAAAASPTDSRFSAAAGSAANPDRARIPDSGA